MPLLKANSFLCGTQQAILQHLSARFDVWKVLITRGRVWSIPWIRAAWTAELAASRLTSNLFGGFTFALLTCGLMTRVSLDLMSLRSVQHSAPLIALVTFTSRMSRLLVMTVYQMPVSWTRRTGWCAAQVFKRRASLLFCFLTTWWPITSVQILISLPTRAFKSPSRNNLSSFYMHVSSMSSSSFLDLQQYADKHNIQSFYDALKAVYGPICASVSSLKTANGSQLINDEEAILNWWREHFDSLLNRPSAVTPGTIEGLQQAAVVYGLDNQPSK